MQVRLASCSASAKSGGRQGHDPPESLSVIPSLVMYIKSNGIACSLEATE